MTGDRHDEIAARLREEGAARAPERLRADVMLQVRAEPRARRIRPRRTYWRPLGSLAAAACLLAAAVFGVTRIDAGAGGSGAGATSAAAGHGAALGDAPSAERTPAPSRVPAQPGHPSGQALSRLARTRTDFGLAPPPLRATYAQRAALAAPLREAFGPLELRKGRGTHTP